MTCHWIDDSWQLHSLSLGCFLHEGDSKSDSLVDNFAIKLFQECGFEECLISAVVSDTTGI